MTKTDLTPAQREEILDAVMEYADGMLEDDWEPEWSDELFVTLAEIIHPGGEGN